MDGGSLLRVLEFRREQNRQREKEIEIVRTNKTSFKTYW